MKRDAALRPRLAPVVISAAVGLLVLKAVGLSTQGGYIFASEAAHAGFGRGVTDARRNPDWMSGDTTGATPAKKGAPPEAVAEKKTEPVQPLPAALPSAAEREVLEQLQARRRGLEEKAKELELREQLLKSAEKMTQERLDELKKSEARQDGDGAGGKVAPDLKAMVTMYESMKPRDAAKVFDKMDPLRLLPLARQMNPKKLGDVLAAMSPENAEKLTGLMLPQPPAKTPRPVQPPLEELERLPLVKTPIG